MSAKDVRSLLEGVGDAGAGPDLPDDALEAELRGLTARVRRRRATRGAALLTGVAAAVVAGAIGVQALEGPEPAPPAQTVTPTPSVEPTPEPTDEPTQTEEPVPDPQPLGDVTEHPMLPPALPLLEGMIEATAEGWLLVGYEPKPADGPGAVHYLVDPDGALYEVPTPIDLGVVRGGFTGTAVRDWLPGTPLVLVGETEVVEGSTEFTVRNILTGEVVGDLSDRTEAFPWTEVEFVRDGTTDLLVTQVSPYPDPLLEVAGVERTTVDGGTVWRMDSFDAPELAARTQIAVALSPDRTRLVVNDGAPRVVRSADLTPVGDVAHPGGGDACVVEEWWGEDHVVLACGLVRVDDHGAGPDRAQLWIAPVGAGVPTLLTDRAQGVQSVALVDDRLITLDRSATPEEYLILDRDGTQSRFPRQDETSPVPPGVVEGRMLDSIGEEVSQLVEFDLWTGGSTVLVPASTPTYLFVAGDRD